MGNLFHDDISTNNIIRGYKIISDYANANDKILLGDGSYITISSLTESLIQRSELDDYVKYVTYSNFTNNIINGTTIIGHSLTASVLKNKIKISLDGVSTSGVVYFDGTTDVTIDITNIDANLIGTGTIDINRLPKGALERLVIVNTEKDKFELTSDSVQRGDSVKVLSDGLMYIVIDDTQLSSALGYMTYSMHRVKVKTIGKMLDQNLKIEGLFSIVLRAVQTEDGYKFVTRDDMVSTAKSPIGMWEEDMIDNDLKAVDTTIREYYDMKPLVDNKPTTKKTETKGE